VCGPLRGLEECLEEIDRPVFHVSVTRSVLCANPELVSSRAA
jgi:hypothetical protein